MSELDPSINPSNLVSEKGIIEDPELAYVGADREDRFRNEHPKKNDEDDYGIRDRAAEVHGEIAMGEEIKSRTEALLPPETEQKLLEEIQRAVETAFHDRLDYIRHQAIEEANNVANELIEQLEKIGIHSIETNSPVTNIHLGGMEDEHIDIVTEQSGVKDEDVQKDVRERAKGNPGSARVLAELSLRGPEIYNVVAPMLGSGADIWLKYKDECRENMDDLIEKYSPDK